MRKTLMAAASLALFAAPAFASDIVPQTNSSGPGSPGTTQEQDMNRSQMQSDQNAQVPRTAPGTTGTSGTSGTTSANPNGAKDPMDPQMNPHNMRKEK